jgi:hypothetical protein
VDLSKRYGCLAGGVNDIRSHPWFRPLDFAALKSRQLAAPIKCEAARATHQPLGSSLHTPKPSPASPACRPSVASADDTSNFDDYSELEPMAHAFALSSAEQALFAGF